MLQTNLIFFDRKMTSVVIIRKGHPKFDAPKIIVLICPKGQTRLLQTACMHLLEFIFDPYFNGNVLKVQINAT